MRFFGLLLVICFALQVRSQEEKLHEFISKQFEYYNYPLEIVTQSNNSVTVLSEVEMALGKDLLLTMYAIEDTIPLFERRLYVDSLFNGRFNSKEINYHFFENNGNLAFLVEKKTKNKVVVYGRMITEGGKMSGLIALDSVIKQDKNLESYQYDFLHTSNKKNIILVCHRNYLSGFRRDKCVMLNVSDFEKTLEIDLPKNSIGVSENYNFDTDFQNNLFYAVHNKYAKIGDSMIVFKVETKTRTLSQFKLVKNTRLMNFKPLFSNQILVYGIINLTFNENDSIKKTLYFQKLNLNTGQMIMDTLLVLSPENQASLSYSYKSLDNDPLSKLFTLISDDIIDGHLITVYEHNHNSIALSDLNRQVTRIDPQNKLATVTEKLEYLVSSFNLATNKVEYVSLIPKKIIYNTNRYDIAEINPFSCIYNNGTINQSMYENRANIKVKPNMQHNFNAFNQVSTLTDVNTVIYTTNNKKLISFNLHGYWRPLNSQQPRKCNKIYYFNYMKHSISIGYYNLPE
ncbi:MAG: hypothetical protein V4677_14155 [Bacteroidota bacterium]